MLSFLLLNDHKEMKATSRSDDLTWQMGSGLWAVLCRLAGHVFLMQGSRSWGALAAHRLTGVSCGVSLCRAGRLVLGCFSEYVPSCPGLSVVAQGRGESAVLQERAGTEAGRERCPPPLLL